MNDSAHRYEDHIEKMHDAYDKLKANYAEYVAWSEEKMNELIRELTQKNARISALENQIKITMEK